MSYSGACHVIVVFMTTWLVAASAARRGTTPVFTGEESIRIAGYGEEKLSTVIVTGTLQCASCSDHRIHVIPISGALVAATCKSNSPYKARNKKLATWIKGTTNKNGVFTIDMPSHLHAIPDLHKACSIKLLSLPKHSPCQSAFKAAKHRAHEIVLSSVGNGIRIYSAGNLQFLHGEVGNLRRCKRESSHGSYI